MTPTWLARPATEVAPLLLGCVLVRQLPNGQIIRGAIVETEAYAVGDPAFHAYKSRTSRNSVVFGAPGISYVYLIYGIYHCFNVVTDLEGVPSAVLIRALQLESVPEGENLQKFAAGPGKLCRAMQIDRSLNGIPLQKRRSAVVGASWWRIYTSGSNRRNKFCANYPHWNL